MRVASVHLTGGMARRFSPARRRHLVGIAAVGVLALLTVLVVGCSSDTSDTGAAPAAAQPTKAAPAATAVPTVAATTASTVAPAATTAATAAPTPTTAAPTAAAATAVPTAPTAEETRAPAPVAAVGRGLSATTASCTPGMSAEEQKAVLVEMGAQLFKGSTAHDEELARLHYAPDARDRRQGGIWLVIEYNGDEAETVAEKKAGIDAQMRDAYQAFFTSGCDELAQVDISARMVATGAGVIGPMAQTLAVVFKTRMKRADADAIDWANKESIDFSKVWDELLLNTRWRKELRSD